VLELDPASHGYAEAPAEQFIDAAVDRLKTLPGVVSAAAMNRVPFYVGFPERLEISTDGTSCAMVDCPTAGTYFVGRDYFRTMNIPLQEGREPVVSPGDVDSAVISATMARRFWPSSDPVGQSITIGPAEARGPAETGPRGWGRRVQIVGVAADIVHRAVGERPEPYIYLPLDQSAFAQPIAIVLRTSGDPAPLLSVVSEQVRAMDPSLPLYRLRTMKQRLDARQQAGRLIISRFFSICGSLALFLSVVGLVGSISYSAGQRSREFGIRAALGSAPTDLAALVVSGALRMAGPGVAIGLVAALLISWVIAGSVTGLDLDSPIVFVIVGLVQFTIAIAAAAIPGRRAGRANALSALRAE
jgi:hypothetical protein